MVVANATNAWDRRETETITQHRALIEYLGLDRHDRAAFLAKSSRCRTYYRAHDWAIRAAAFDDARDRDYEVQRAAAVREMRERHATIGKALLTFAVSKLTEIDITKPADLIKLADLARRMELVAMTGAEGDIGPTSRSAIEAAGVPVDEWDRLAAELSATIPRRA